MSEIRKAPVRQEIRVYITLEELASWIGRPVEGLRVSHLDNAPDDKDKSVRICLIEETDG